MSEDNKLPLKTDKTGPEPKAAATVQSITRPVKALQEAKLGAAEFFETRFLVDLLPDTPYEHISDPKFWAHVSGKLRHGVVIIVRDAENTYRAEFIVRNLGQGWAKVEELSKHEFKVSTAGPEKLADHKIEYVNPSSLWRVVRLSDNYALKDGFRDWDAANAWLIQHKRQIAA